MATGGRFSFDGMEQLQRQIEQLDGQTDEFITACAKELAARLLAKVIKRTLPGDYTEEITYVAKRDGRSIKRARSIRRESIRLGKREEHSEEDGLAGRK